MSKKFLIITSTSETTVAWSQREAYLREFCEHLESQVENVRVIFTTYDDLTFSVLDGRLKIFDQRNNLALETVNLVHFKNWTYEAEEAGLVARYLAQFNVPFYNSEVAGELTQNKITQMFILSAQNLPVPDTIFAKKKVLAKIVESGELPPALRFPLIMKANNGSRGDDNYLAKNAAEALKILADPENAPTDFVLQQFIANDGDYRFLFIGLDEEPLLFKRTASGGSHLNNTSKGGAGKFIKAGELSAELVSAARKAATILKREIGGTDIIIDKDSGQFYILEVNGTPALATGFGREEKANKFAAFLKQTLEVEEEE